MKRNGIRKRDDGATLQAFYCSACKKTYIDPRLRLPSGPPRNESGRARARALRKSGYTYKEISEKLGVSIHWAYALSNRNYLNDNFSHFTVSVRPPLRRSLQEMYVAQGGHGPNEFSLGQYISEIVENAIVDFRARKITPEPSARKTL